MTESPSMFKIFTDEAKLKKAAATAKQYPHLKNWEEMQHYMKIRKTFMINSTKITFRIPIGLNSYLKKAILKSHALLRYFNIQEDAFCEKDWTVISQGLIERKSSQDSPANVQITFTNINQNNFGFIRDIIHKANIQKITFHDCTFEDGFFSQFCDAFKDAAHPHEAVNLTTNNLTQDQIKEAILKIRNLIVYKSQIRIIDSIEELKKFNKMINRYYFEGLDTLNLTDFKVEDPLLCHAVKVSKCLRTIVTTGAAPSEWKWMTEAIITNDSIRSLVIYSANTTIANERLFGILKEIFAKKRITDLEIVENFGYTPEERLKWAEIIALNSSLKRFTLTGFTQNDEIQSAIKQHPIITELMFKKNTMSKEKLIEVIQANRRINKLTFYLTSITSHDKLIHDLFHIGLHELHFYDCDFGGPMQARHISREISKNKSLQAFSFTESKSANQTSLFKDILSHNHVLKKLDLTLSQLTPDDAIIILESAKNSKLTSFAMDLRLAWFKTFVDMLQNNTTLTHLGISFDPLEFNYDQLEELKSAIEGLKGLKSFSAVTDRNHGVVIQFIEESFSVTSFQYRVKEWSGSFSSIIESLKINKSINKIVIVEHDLEPVKRTLDPAFRELLKRNRDEQTTYTSNLLYLMGVMAARPQSFLSILPLELWSNIFRRITIPGVDLDFNKVLLQHFEKS